MTEEQWLCSTDLTWMLQFLRGKISDRKLRLFAVASCRHLLRQVQVRPVDVRAVDVAERYADGEASDAELAAAARYVPGPPSAHRTAGFACQDTASMEAAANLADYAAENAAWAAGEHAASPVGADPRSPEFAAAQAAERATQAAILRDLIGPLPFRVVHFDPAWRTPAVMAWAAFAYDDRRFADLPILADALEEAGCTDAELLGHLRLAGPHFLGCWGLDAVLGKG